MNRSTAWCVPLVTFLFATPAYAADRGFYFAATASRVEHDVEGYPGMPIATATLSPNPPVLVIRPAPGSGVIIPIVPPVPNVIGPARIEIDDVDTGFGLSVGYRINRYLAAELTYTDFGEYERIQRFPTVADVRDQISVSGWSVSVLGSLPLNEQWELFLRGGVLFADQEVSIKVISSFDRDYSDEVVMAGAGVQWSFAPRWATRLEYQRTGDLKYDNTGESTIDQASLSVLFKL